ncbi:hypothetical protein GH714_040203 [Hevea brasiliensis]|uniref:MULE transposase domain-containing protein n=1 Tax=Hevea brasiliensis TaxID=3981 RepID=A0A6A6LA18_HEVBR|nr:hypothetical protein GH714_040203 [Hevea brasiliensis]
MFSEGELIKYSGGFVILGQWMECDLMKYDDIVNKCRELGYGEDKKVGYFKVRGDWKHQTLVFNDTEVKQLWEEGANFGFLKLFIEFKTDIPIIEDEIEVPITNVPLMYKGNDNSEDLDYIPQEQNEKDKSVDESLFFGLDDVSRLQNEIREHGYVIGRDGNNQMLPISWCVVERDNEESWKWFVERLFEDLNIIDGLGLTIGLAKAIEELVPHIEHLNCVRHIYANWKKLHKVQKFKSLFWKVVYATYKAAFKKLKDLDVKAYEDFMKQDPKFFVQLSSTLGPMEKNGRPRKYPASLSKTRKEKVENQGVEPIETSIQQSETTLNQQDTMKQNAVDLRMVRKGFGAFVSKANGSIYAKMPEETTINIMHGQSSFAVAARGVQTRK